MTDDFPKITEAEIKRFCSAQSFQRGLEYYHSEALFDLVRQEHELRAYCEGSSYEAYRVTVTLGAQGVEQAHCTCPYDWGGYCKHLVAVLLAWVHEPESFHTIPALDELLANRSKKELITLIKEMLQRQPDLIRVLELPVQPDRRTPLDMDAYRRQIKHALRRHNDYDYPNAGAVATELTALVQTAQRFQQGGDWLNAGALYALILSEVVRHYSELYDEDGDVAVVLQECAQGLQTCLSEGTPDAATRRSWFEALLAVALKDIDMGGLDLGYPAGEIIITYPTDEEWAWIEAEIRRTLASKTGPYSDWSREQLVGLLTQRLEARGHTTQADTLMLELGTPQQQAFLLAQRGRIEEAVAIAKKHFTDLPGLVTRFADALVEAGAGPAAEAYLNSLLNTRSRPSYLSWLANYAGQTGRWPVALEWWRQTLQEQPSFATYQKVKEAAQQLKQWEQLRPEIQAELTAKQSWPVLIEAALDEGEVQRALELLPRLKWDTGSYALRVAKAAESDYPQAALEIYRRRAENLIKARGRSNYQSAATILAQVRQVYQNLNDSEGWTKYITHMRLENQRLPALLDELKRAKVI